MPSFKETLNSIILYIFSLHQWCINFFNHSISITQVQDRNQVLEKDLTQTKKSLRETEEEKKRLDVESGQLKEMCRRELERAEQESSRNAAIISDYKQICSQLSQRLESQQKAAREELLRIKVNDLCYMELGDIGEF